MRSKCMTSPTCDFSNQALLSVISLNLPLTEQIKQELTDSSGSKANVKRALKQKGKSKIQPVHRNDLIYDSEEKSSDILPSIDAASSRRPSSSTRL